MPRLSCLCATSEKSALLPVHRLPIRKMQGSYNPSPCHQSNHYNNKIPYVLTFTLIFTLSCFRDQNKNCFLLPDPWTRIANGAIHIHKTQDAPCPAPIPLIILYTTAAHLSVSDTSFLCLIFFCVPRTCSRTGDIAGNQSPNEYRNVFVGWLLILQD